MAIKRQARIQRHGPLGYLQSPNETKAKFINVCCGDGIRQRSLDDGLTIFSNIVEKRMLECENSMADLLNMLWASHPELTSYLERQFLISTKIVRFIRSSTEQPSIDDIVKLLYEHFNVSAANMEEYEEEMRNLVFIVIGWSTMLYTVISTAEGINLSDVTKLHLTHGLAKQTVILVQHSCQRPVGSMLRSQGLMPISCSPDSHKSPQGLPTRLTVPFLNFYSLSRLGNVTITWVNDLSSHCDFDRYGKRKQLKLFRLPSLCAKIFLNENDDTYIDRLFKSHSCQENCWSNPESVAKPYLVEVLLSYRLLFGQHPLSRGLFLNQERKNAEWDDTLDPLLEALCGHEHVSGFDGTEEYLHERGVYDADINFPHLGPRLMELADYSSSQRPGNLFEVWCDQRDPEKLLTFKAVIIIGAASIALSILQVLVGVVQIVISIHR
ncbi:hypothetical protein F4805DRAFT_148997 [Annulohypoxylon moriforme]|nr:hypothetical protein F4805DRAFT_148997 [Annulohypoxylon moriforme]